MPAHWLVTDAAHTYRTARGADLVPEEHLVFMAENDLLAQGHEPHPPQDVPAPVYPRSA